MTGQTKSIWNTLLVTAQRKSGIAHNAMQQAEQRKQQALDRRQKIKQLLIEYGERLKSIQSENHSTAEATNYREFITQLQEIYHRAADEITLAERGCNEAKKDLLTAEQARLKHQKLVQREADKQNKRNQLAEVKATDTQNMIQFNINSNPHRQ